MEVIIKGTEKEIAGFIKEIQSQLSSKDTSFDELCHKMLECSMAKSARK